MRNSPVSRTCDFLKKMSGNATPRRGSAILEILNLKPRNETIQNVVVVPRLAPSTMPIDSVTVSRLALTKLTMSTVVADED